MDKLLTKFKLFFLFILIGCVINPALANPPTLTQHKITINNKTYTYQAMVGLMPIGPKKKPLATMSYVAYMLTNKNGKIIPNRPLTFAYNGGPGVSSNAILFGGIGPKIVQYATLDTKTSVPGKVINNQYTWLPQTNLVFIDEPGTGFGKIFNKKARNKLLGLVGDTKAFGQFIVKFLNQHHQWNSPLYLAGESYGGERSVYLANYLLQQYSIGLNGLILISPELNDSDLIPTTTNVLPYALSLPSMAAVSLHFKKYKFNSLSQRAAIKSIQQWALNTYLPALEQGDNLAETQYNQIAIDLNKITGISTQFIKNHNLRISIEDFLHQFDKNDLKTLGVYNGTVWQYKLLHPDFYAYVKPVVASAEASPLFNTYGILMQQSYLNYISKNLNYKLTKPYLPAIDTDNWKWMTSPYNNKQNDTVRVLHNYLVNNPKVKLLVTSGYYDLSCPYFGVHYELSQLNLPKNIQWRVKQITYFSAHPVYLMPDAVADFSRDIKGFYG